MNGTRISSAIVASAIALTYGAWAASGADDFMISRSTIDGGGTMNSTGGNFELSGTIGQPDAGSMSGGSFTLTGGFWFALATGDCNTDGGVNLIDYDDLEPCLSGPNGGLPFPDCNCFDIDGDNDVDLSDVARFVEGFSGS